jgi:hypothetical protein
MGQMNNFPQSGWYIELIQETVKIAMENRSRAPNGRVLSPRFGVLPMTLCTHD